MRLEAKDVNISISGKPIVQHLSIEVPDRKFSALLGANGSGKTTLLRSIYRTQKMDSGIVRLDDEDITHFSGKKLARNMAVMGQFNQINFDYTVLDIALMGRYPFHSLLEQEKELVQSALEFNDTTVEDILTPRVNMVAIDEESTPQEVLQIITEEGFSRIPVYSETVDHIIGVVHTRDILQAALLNKNFDIKKLMTEPMYVHRSMKIARLLSEFQRKKVHIAIVMDDYGGTLGIVTMEDVLEELVGEIYDERDEVVTEFTEVTPDTYEISGDMPVDDFLDEIDYHPADIEEDDYDTMNGLALSVLEHIPAVGETFQLGRLTFTVLEMEEQKIEKMRVILAPDSEKEAEKEKEKD